MLTRTCAFETARLRAGEWHALASDAPCGEDLPRVVAAMLTAPVTRALPSAWQGHYTVERARAWIRERDATTATLLVVDKSTKDPVGLMILTETDAAEGRDGREVRVGYLLAEHAWGKGLASELVGGLVEWCRGQPAIASIAGGVAHDNAASRRVLEKHGFILVEGEGTGEAGERHFRLWLRE